ncbi:MAG: adenylyltransferase/cytidyltransferase family protein [Patescibacteria group bacterium]
MKKKRKVVVAVSGGFDPVHVGHVRLFNEAKKLGDELVVILNNDNWLKDKKGFVFMSQKERKEILEAIHGVDRVLLTDHKPGEYFKDRSVCRFLRKIRPDIFANGGDRKPEGDPVPEVVVCEELGIELVYNVGEGGKVQSSSGLLKEAVKVAQVKRKS